MNEFHLYRGRHLFRDDDHIGKFDFRSRTLRLFAAYADEKDRAAAYFRAKQSINPRVLVGDEEPEQDAPPVELPPGIAVFCSPHLGAREPAVMRWAAENWPRETFREFYGCDPEPVAEDDAAIEIEAGTDDTAPAPEPAKKKPGRPKKS